MTVSLTEKLANMSDNDFKEFLLNAIAQQDSGDTSWMDELSELDELPSDGEETLAILGLPQNDQRPA